MDAQPSVRLTVRPRQALVDQGLTRGRCPERL